MKITQKKLKLIAILMFGLGLTGLQAQESINTTGGKASGSGGTVSYSVGQVVYATNAGTNGSVAEGVQQPYEISVITAIEEAKDINLSVTAYPNPTIDYLTLEMQSFVQTQDFASLYDINGNLLQKIPITNQQTRIDMNNLAPATYFLKVTVKTQDFASQELKTQDLASQEVKTFKIIKN